MLNKLILIGHVGQDPKVTALKSGDTMVTFSLATSERWKDKATGERKERTQWHNVVIFNQGLAKVAEQFVGKGSKLYIEGQLLSRPWTDDKGVERQAFECVLKPYTGALVLLDKQARDDRPPAADEASYAGAAPPPKEAPASAVSAAAPGKFRGDLDDEIPF